MVRRRVLRTLGRRAAGLSVALWLASAAQGQISPGPLSRPHAGLEGSDRCLGCHSARKGVDPARCAVCHAALAQRIQLRQGLHARPEYKACERCHIEHQGRAAELVWWGERGVGAFDHAATGYRLEGAHGAVACRGCHRPQNVRALPPKGEKTAPSRTFLGLSMDCKTCHQDPHQGQFGVAGCASCHGQKAWKPANFDHDRSRFPLTGKHRAVSCARCHAGASTGGEKALKFRGTPSDCASCHRDPHQERFGARCASCHRTDDWKRIESAGFDHRRTRFPLEGRHAAVACASCHRPGAALRIPGFERCSTCHADPHFGQMERTRSGGECAPCHGAAGFRPSRFTVADHESTAYPLVGAHRGVPCLACHAALPPGDLARAGVVLRPGGRLPAKVQRFRFAVQSCEGCHRDPHGVGGLRQQPASGCAACHAIAKWNAIQFDHAPTGFALSGAHRAVACTQCHRPVRTAGSRAPQVPLTGAAKECVGCHADPHGGQFARRGGAATCASCHTATDWQPALFDHNRDSVFQLDGAHRAVACVGCHPIETTGSRTLVRYRPLSRACQDCHAVTVPR